MTFAKESCLIIPTQLSIKLIRFVQMQLHSFQFHVIMNIRFIVGSDS